MPAGASAALDHLDLIIARGRDLVAHGARQNDATVRSRPGILHRIAVDQDTWMPDSGSSTVEPHFLALEFGHPTLFDCEDVVGGGVCSGDL